MTSIFFPIINSIHGNNLIKVKTFSNFSLFVKSHFLLQTH